MAVEFDAWSNETAAASGTLTWTHTPVGNPKGIFLWVVQNVGVTDEVDSVTYGSLTMTEVAGSPLVNTTGEPGAVYGYFNGSAIPTGVQTVTVNVNGTGSFKQGGVATLVALANTETVEVDVSINGDLGANPSTTLSLNGRASWCGLAFFSGVGVVASATPLTGWTTRNETDFGAQLAGFYTYNTIGTTDVTAGWTQSADQATAICVAISEASAAGSVLEFVTPQMT